MDKYALPQNMDLDNPEFKNLWELITMTHQSVFLTGKAGTGKSTFLKYICANTKKNYIVLAPTGIAAVNVGGMTLHSFFKIPFKPLLPDDVDFSIRRIRNTLKYNKEKVKILQRLDLIIIDEISMVRADIIDFIDKVLRVYCKKMREPFGGKQLLLVGDVFQLEPVVTADTKEILRRYYNQFFFFNAKVFESLNLVPIELTKMYRQNNKDFISLLDSVRNASIGQNGLSKINSRFSPVNNSSPDELVITLAMRRDTVDHINEEELRKLQSPEVVFEGSIKDEFPDSILPTSKTLILKVGAQVLFIRNDKEQRWVNGTIGKVVGLEDGIFVELENGTICQVEKEVWENMKYSYDDKKKAIKEDVLGIFQQYPIKPAWALTVHKSQGLTFNRVNIDFGSGGAFAGGQTYVALSRCTSLEGITLRQPISFRDILVNPEVVKFSRNFNNTRLIENAIYTAKADIDFKEASCQFEKMNFEVAVDKFFDGLAIENIMTKPITKRIIRLKLQKLKALSREIQSMKDVIHEKNKTLRNLADEYVRLGNDSLLYTTGDNLNDDTSSYASKVDAIAVKSAMANYNKAISLFPECAEAYSAIGDLYVKLGEYEEGIKNYDIALGYDINNAEMYMRIGKAYMVNKDYDEALKALKNAIKADKNNPTLYETLSQCYDKIGFYELSCAARAKAEKLRKNNK